MQHIVQTLDMFAERISSAVYRLQNLSDRLVGPQPETPAPENGTRATVPAVMYQIGNSLSTEGYLIDRLFSEINRLEEALQMNSEHLNEPKEAAVYMGSKRLGGGLI